MTLITIFTIQCSRVHSVSTSYVDGDNEMPLCPSSIQFLTYRDHTVVLWAVLIDFKLTN